MKCHQTEQSTEGRSAAGYTYPKGRLLPSCFVLTKISGFHNAKTSANKRFYNMSSCFTSVSDGMLVSYKLYNAINADWHI